MWLPVPRLVEHDGVRGIAIVLKPAVDGHDEEHEVGRVAFVRKESIHPEVPFEDQLRMLVLKADEAAEVLNDLWAEFKRVKEIDREQRRQDDEDAISEGLAKLRDLFPAKQVLR